MSAWDRVNHMAVRMRTEHLLHPITGAKCQITCGVKVPKSTVQDALREFVTVMTFHYREPIEKESCQWQSMPVRCFASDVTQSRFGQGKHHVRLEVLHSFV